MAHEPTRPGAMKPFIFNEVFDVNTNLRIARADVPGVPAIMADDFLKHPAEAREITGNAAAANWKHAPGGRNFVDYRDCRVRFPIFLPNNMLAVAQQLIQSVYGVRTMPQDPHMDVNWFQQINPRRQDYAFPHHDVRNANVRSYTCLVYLNTKEETSGGTAFFRFKPTGALTRDAAFERATTTMPEIVEDGRDYWLESGPKYWDFIGHVPMAPGRFMIFPSEFFHAAYHPVDSFFDFPRLTLAFWMLG